MILLTGIRGVRVIDHTRDQLRYAAQLRAAIGVKTPDVLRLLAAMASGCRSFVTNDRRIPAVTGTRRPAH